MSSGNKADRYSIFITIVAWGAMWGIFEATVGYLLHSISFGYSWLVWYPIACFFMANVYRKTQKVSSIFFVGLLCASIKMLNLFFPIRIDKIINPAIAIVFESLAMVLILFAANHLFGEKHKSFFMKALFALAMNTSWRMIFILYLLFLVPDWIRDVSVISNAEKFISFLITQNLITSLILFIGYQFMDTIFKPIKALEHQISALHTAIPTRAIPILKTGVVAFMLCVNIILELML